MFSLIHVYLYIFLQVSGVNTQNKTIQFVSGDSLKYDKVMFATGGRSVDII